MNDYPPGEYVSHAKQSLPEPGPDLPPKTVLVNAGPLWGHYRITFVAKRNPRQGMRHFWYWSMDSGERIEFSQPASRGGLREVVVGAVHEADHDIPKQPAVSSNWPKPQPESTVKITDLIAALARIRAEHGDLTVAEEKPLGFMAVQYVETQHVPPHRAVLGVSDGEIVVVVKAQ